jgi:hypothetical protein
MLQASGEMTTRTVTTQDSLARCEGFRVDYPGGHLGIVEVVLHGEDGVPKAIAAVGGLFGTRIVIIPVDEIAEVDQRARRITLVDKPEIGHLEHFAEVLKSHGHNRID